MGGGNYLGDLMFVLGENSHEFLDVDLVVAL